MLEKHNSICPSVLQSFPSVFSVSIHYCLHMALMMSCSMHLRYMHRWESIFLFWYGNNFWLCKLCPLHSQPVFADRLWVTAINVTYSRLQYLRNTTTVDYLNQLLYDCVIQLGLIHMAPVITLQQFCDPVPFAQFVSYEKGFKPCEKLPLCLIFLCCLNQGKLGHRKIWMKHTKRADLVAKESLWHVDLQKSQHTEGERGFTWR